MNTQSKLRPRGKWLTWAILFTVGLAIGALIFGGPSTHPGKDSTVAQETNEAQEATTWTCSMHPQIQAPGPGKCPICFMDLIPVDTGDSGGSETQLVMSESSMRLAEVVTAPVTRRSVKSELRTVGKVVVDERRLKRLTAWVGGRLDRLYVDYTGVSVAEGDHLVKIYSPQLYSTQVELVESLKAREKLKESNVDFLRESAQSTVEAAREKLRLLGLRPEQIQDIEQRKQPSEHITLYAPMAGVVIHKAAVEGEYVKTGSPIYTIADLSHVWVVLDVYESDLVWLQHGQDVSFEVEAFPGDAFVGQISFIDPVVNPVTRTVKVRVNVENTNLRLKPDMFVRAVIRSSVTSDGRSLSPDLAGKWICPMHFEIVKDGPGPCDICGMPVVPAESLGLALRDPREELPLIIPVTAALITGKRTIVYVRVPGTEKPTFEGREIVLGPRAGDFYIVKEGLHPGEDVVVHGSFKIDSAMQIQAKPSMMSPEGGAPPPTHQHGESQAMDSPVESQHPMEMDSDLLKDVPDSFRESLAPTFQAYFSLQSALAQDDFETAQEASEALDRSLQGIAHTELPDPARGAWDDLVLDLNQRITESTKAGDLEESRIAFASISELLIDLDRSVGPPDGQTHSLIYCSMAFNNKGAYWLQETDQVQNPFYGKSMQRCGEIKEAFGSSHEGSGQ